jgi:hypothetical protein
MTSSGRGVLAVDQEGGQVVSLCLSITFYLHMGIRQKR